MIDYTVIGKEATSVKAGDRVLCENGHHVCDIVKDASPGMFMNCWGQVFGNWRQAEPETGKTVMPIRCEECDGLVIVSTPTNPSLIINLQDAGRASPHTEHQE